MKDYANDLALEFKSRTNKKIIGNVVGTVLSVNPLMIGLLNNAAKVNSDNGYICDGLTLIYGDKVLVICDVIEETFYIINKISKVV